MIINLCFAILLQQTAQLVDALYILFLKIDLSNNKGDYNQ